MAQVLPAAEQVPDPPLAVDPPLNNQGNAALLAFAANAQQGMAPQVNMPPGFMPLALPPNAGQPPLANAPQFAANPLAMQALMLMLQQPQGQEEGPIMGALPGAPPVLGGLNAMPPQWAGDANPPVFVPGWAHGQMVAPMAPLAAPVVRRRRPATLTVPAAVSWQQFTVDCYNMELWRAAQAADVKTVENLLARYELRCG